MTELRQLRRDADLSQHDLAELLDVPVNTLRMWDSGLRLTPAHIVHRAQVALATRATQHKLLLLDQLAKVLRVH